MNTDGKIDLHAIRQMDCHSDSVAAMHYQMNQSTMNAMQGQRQLESIRMAEEKMDAASKDELVVVDTVSEEQALEDLFDPEKDVPLDVPRPKSSKPIVDSSDEWDDDEPLIVGIKRDRAKAKGKATSKKRRKTNAKGKKNLVKGKKSN